MLVLTPAQGKRIGRISLTLADGRRPKEMREDGMLFYTVPAGASLTLGW
jgi:hypothetical protein